MEEHGDRHSAPGSRVHCVGLNVMSQSSPGLSRVPPCFCPDCSLCLECPSPSPCQLTLQGLTDVLPSLQAEAEALQSGSPGLCACLSQPPNTWPLEKMTFHMSALLYLLSLVTAPRLGGGGNVLSWVVGDVGSSSISGLGHAM